MTQTCTGDEMGRAVSIRVKLARSWWGWWRCASWMERVRNSLFFKHQTNMHTLPRHPYMVAALIETENATCTLHTQPHDRARLGAMGWPAASLGGSPHIDSRRPAGVAVAANGAGTGGDVPPAPPRRPLVPQSATPLGRARLGSPWRWNGGMGPRAVTL